MLEVEGLRKAYGKIVVADDIGFTLAAGDCLGVIGPNGAGKSSLFNLLTGTAPADAGRIRLAGHDLAGLPVHRRARLGMARAFQIPQPISAPERVRQRARGGELRRRARGRACGRGGCGPRCSAPAWHAPPTNRPAR